MLDHVGPGWHPGCRQAPDAPCVAAQEMNRHDAVTELWRCPAGEQQPERAGSLFHYSLSAPAVSICERLGVALQRRVPFSRVVPQ